MGVVIHGNGAHGADIAKDLGERVVGFVDDDLDLCTLETNYTYGYPFIVGINDSAARRRVAERGMFANREGPYVGGQWVHSEANLGPDVTIGEHTHINAGAFLARCTLGDFVTVGPNATICGDVTIGDDVMIGAGAVIKNLITIGDGAVIGCGAVVVEDVPPGVTVVGNPARPLVRSSC